jgi:UDP-N-acetylmuramate dehydrogenase
MSFTAGFEHFLQPDEPLASYNWLRLGGPAQYLAEPTTPAELEALVTRARDNSLPVRLLGGGSNVLVRDEGVPGVVIRLTAPAFCEIRVEKNRIIAGGGAKLGHVISSAVREGLAGLEQLVGIPGTVGGALHGNAGTHGGDVGQFTDRATVLTRAGKLIQRERADLHFAYRTSSLDELAILSAEFVLESESPQHIARRMQTLWIVKRAEQPSTGEGCARLFKNPRGGSAAQMIEQAGLKGSRVGGAEISSRSANFVLVHEDATSSDVLRLMELVQRQVADRLGVELEREIVVW